MRVAEVFGYDLYDESDVAWGARNAKYCRFRSSPCTKSSKTEPLGICSLTDGEGAASLCPVRFLENERIFKDAARIAFGESTKIGVFPEIRILEIAPTTDGGKAKKIGKVDFLIGVIEDGQVTDFAAVEIQAAYFSGPSLRRPFGEYIETQSIVPLQTERRPDFRSCAQKRLIPQLQLKIPVFRRWGKKFFVVVDDKFFGSLPEFPKTSQNNSELTWLSYPISKNSGKFEMQKPEVLFSEWDEVQNSLREGKPPEPNEIVDELQSKLDGPAAKRPLILEI